MTHHALPYAGDAHFVETCVSLLGAALNQNQRPLLLAQGAKLSAVREALDDSADEITFVAVDEHGRNPNRILTMLDSFQSAGSGRRSFGINEPVFGGRSPLAVAEAEFGESLLNTDALGSWPLDLVCLYDTSVLDGRALECMRRVHPVVRGEPTNPGYDPELALRTFATPPPPLPADAPSIEAGRTALGGVRNFVRAFAAEHRVAADRAEDLVLAVNEVATNSLRHGGGRCRVTGWRDGDYVGFEVADDGCITDPLVGRLAPPPDAASGRGLWLANHLCDIVSIRSGADGTVVRLFIETA